MYYNYICTYFNPLPPTLTYYPYSYDLYNPQPPPASPPLITTPTRTLLLSLVPYDANETTVRRDLALFGEIRAVEMERLSEGLVTVHFYDILQATEALHGIQEQYIQQQQQHRVGEFYYVPYWYTRHYASVSPPPAPGLINGRAVWAEFTFPDGKNQGTLVVFNLNSDVTAGMLKETFEAFGRVKEVREPASSKKPKFVEFYDTRHALEALININGKDINGKTVVVKFSRPKHNGFQNAPPAPPKEQPGSCSSSKQGKDKRHVRDECDPRFLIKDEDSRTTAMIKNIPNKYSKNDLVEMLDRHCIHCNKQITGDQPPSSYDFLHLPTDYENKCNVGYGFVNMTSPEATMRLYEVFNHHKWENVLNSEKICQVTYARVQGLDALKEHFKDSRFPGDEYMPVVFDPPRDGQRCTQGTPIVLWERPKSIILFGSFPTVL